MIEARQVIDFVAAHKYVEERSDVHPRLTDYNNDSTTTFDDVQAFFRILENRLSRRLNAPEPVQRQASETPLQPPGLSMCLLQLSKEKWVGSCGSLFGQQPVLTIAKTTAITTGAWRKDVQPSAAWAGTMTDAGYPDAPIEIEIYAGGTGALRTEYGWFPVSGFDVGSTIRFQVDAVNEVLPNAVDREIVERAIAILKDDAVWNRADDRKCMATAATFSIYCAVERASMDLLGAFHHRRPAAELVREIVGERTQGRPYKHRLMDYNNDLSTHLSDVQSLFAEALRRIK